MGFFHVRRSETSAPDAASPYRTKSEHRRVVSGLAPTSSLAAIFLLLVCAAPCQAGTVRQLTDQKGRTIGGGSPGTTGISGAASLDDAGTTVYVNAVTNQLGGNPEHRFQIFRFDAATGAGQQITSLPRGSPTAP